MPSVIPYKGQIYSELKKKALNSGELFTDPEFPAEEKSLFNTPGKGRDVKWLRPKDICDNPQLFVDGVNSCDLIQGELGNCWFVAASSTLAANKNNWHQVIPDHKEQDWDKQHAGIFHFRFWRFGNWTDVVIDDRLPTRNGRLIYTQSQTRTEFWSALLEKAYAKLFGCYEALDGGELAEALEDFTGGVSESFDMADEHYAENEEKKQEFYDWLKKSLDRGSLICAAIPAKSSDEMEKATDVGLIKGHAYAVTAIRRPAIEGTGIFNLFNREKIDMIRLRNPWGGSEWKGPFSDGSPEWNKIAKSDRDRIGLTFDDDGEFWMTFDDFCRHFINIAICHTINTSIVSLSKRWHESIVHSEWSPTLGRAGGCINNKETVLNNPQILFDITEDDEPMMQLIQKSNRKPNEERMTIGFTILKVEENRLYRVHVLPSTVIASSVYRNSRSIFLRKTLTKGRYIVVICTFEPGLSGQFMYRIYSSNKNYARELVLDKPKKKACCTCLPLCRYPICVTQVRVIKATGLERKDKSSVCPYFIISCEGESVRSPTLKNTSKPEWNTSAIFYRKNPVGNPIKIEVWHNAIGFDEFLGQEVFVAAKDSRNEILELALKTKEKGGEASLMPGKLYLVVTTDHNLAGV